MRPQLDVVPKPSDARRLPFIHRATNGQNRVWGCALIRWSTIVFIAAAWLSPTLLKAQPSESEAERVEAEKPGDETAADTWERLIYLPYKNLKGVFDKQDGSVVIPYLEYLKMWNSSSGGAARNQAPPVSAVITQTHYSGHVDKNLARINAKFTIQMLDENWAEIPIRFGKAAVGKMTSSGRALLRGTGEGTYSLILQDKGEHTVNLELVARVHTSPEGKSLELECPPVGMTTFEFNVPEADQTIQISPQLVALPVEAGEKETRVKANLGSTEKIIARWYPRAGTKPEMDLLAAVNNTLSVTVDEGLLHTSASLEYDVLRGELNQLRFAVPLGHRILDVSAPQARVKGWNAQSEDNRQLVTVDLLGSVSGTFTVQVHTEFPIADETVSVAGIDDEGTVHGIHSIDTIRESGQLIVAHSPSMSIAVEQQQGLLRVAAADVSRRLRRSGALFYKFYSPRFSLDLSTRPVKPELSIEQSVELTFDEDQLRLKSELAYTIKRSGVFELRVQLPEGFELDSVGADSMKEYAVDEASHILTVSLNQKQMGELGLSLAGHLPLETEDDEQILNLPLPEPLAVERETGHILVYAPQAVEVITDESELTGAYPDPQAAAPSRARLRLTSAWTYTRRPVEIPVTTRRKPTRLTASIGTSIRVRQELTEVRTLLTYKIEHAGVDTFRFSVPEAVADSVQIRSLADSSAPAIQQKSRADDAQDGQIVWTVIMQQDVLGRQPFEIRYDLKPQKADGAESWASDVPVVRALGLDDEEDELETPVELSGTDGEIAITKDRALSVSAEATGDDIESIDVRELTLLGKEGALAYRYYKQPVNITLEAAKNEIQEVVETIISRAAVEVVAGREDKLTWRCRYRLKSSERQRLTVDLPTEVEPLAVLVDRTEVQLEKNEAVTPEAGWESYFVNVARSKKSDEPFLLTLQFLTPVKERTLESAGGRILLRLPKLGGESAVAVQQTRAAVWVPEKFALTGAPDNFVPEGRRPFQKLLFARSTGEQHTGDLDRWIGSEAGGIIDFPTEGHAYRYRSLGGSSELTLTYWKMPFYARIISLALILVAWVLRKTSFENKIGILLLLALAAALYSLEDADGALHGLMAARLGLLGMAAFWIVHLFYGSASSARAATPSAATSTPAAAVIPPPGLFETSKPKKDEPPTKPDETTK